MPVFLDAREKRVFFAHVPKTGGTYIEDLFRQNGYERHFWDGYPHRLGLTCSPQHYHAAFFAPLLDLDGMDFGFMTVRNPVDRLLSEYRHQAKTIKDGSAIAPLTVWLENMATAMWVTPLMMDNHMRPQVDFYHPTLEIFRQEDGFDRKWAKAVNRKYGLGLKKFDVPRRRNTSVDQAPLSSGERDALIDFCTEQYKADFEFFKYQPEHSALMQTSDRAMLLMVCVR